jgi:hypothetical protein
MKTKLICACTSSFTIFSLTVIFSQPSLFHFPLCINFFYNILYSKFYPILYFMCWIRFKNIVCLKICKDILLC